MPKRRTRTVTAAQAAALGLALVGAQAALSWTVARAADTPGWEVSFGRLPCDSATVDVRAGTLVVRCQIGTFVEHSDGLTDLRWSSAGDIGFVQGVAADTQAVTIAGPAAAVAGLRKAILESTPKAESAPTMRVGDCSDTTVAAVTGRLGGKDFSMGVAVTFANGIFVTSYDADPVATSHVVGDPVRVCLASVPDGCPPGDDRGKTYTVTVAGTKRSYTMANAQHMCGGA